MTIIPHRLPKTLAFATVIAPTGLVPALDATGGIASASASAPTAESGSEIGAKSAPTSADLQYRDAETGERLSGVDIIVTAEQGEERVVEVVGDGSTQIPLRLIEKRVRHPPRMLTFATQKQGSD